MRPIGVACLTGCLALSLAASALAQAPVKLAAKQQKAPRVNPVTASYEAMSLADRVAIQSELIWTGDYNGIANGEFTDRAIAAVKAYQARNSGKQTGVLNPQERAALAVTAKTKQDAAGWRMVDDRPSGTRLGVPLKLVPQSSTTKNGTHWTSAHGEGQVDTFRISEPGTTLASVYERQRKEPAGRKPEYNVLREDFFVISGLQGLKKFYVRGSGRDGDVRGVTILYDQAMEGIWDPVVIAMSSAFTPFPGGSASAPPARRKVEYGTGIVVSPQGHVITDRQLVDGCAVVTLAGRGNADVVAEDKTYDLALLRVYGARELSPITFAGEPAGAQVTLVGVADPQAQGGGDAASTATARVGTASGPTRTLEPAPAPGFSGAAATDQGRLVGMAEIRMPSVAGPTPATPQATFVPIEPIRKFLAEHKIAPADGSADLERAKTSVVRVICVRK
jgi:S1-C subfamily serine protease